MLVQSSFAEKGGDFAPVEARYCEVVFDPRLIRGDIHGCKTCFIALHGSNRRASISSQTMPPTSKIPARPDTQRATWWALALSKSFMEIAYSMRKHTSSKAPAQIPGEIVCA